MTTLNEILSDIAPYGSDEEEGHLQDDSIGTLSPYVRRVASNIDRLLANRAQGQVDDLRAIQDFADDYRNRYPNPYMAGYALRTRQDAEYQHRNRVEHAYDEFSDPDAVQRYAEKHPEFAAGYNKLQDYYRRGGDVEETLNYQIEVEPFLRKAIAFQPTPDEAIRDRDYRYANSGLPELRSGNYGNASAWNTTVDDSVGSLSNIPEDLRRSQKQWVGEDNLREAQLLARESRTRDGREERAWEDMHARNLEQANKAVLGEENRDRTTESLWRAIDRRKAQSLEQANKTVLGEENRGRATESSWDAIDRKKPSATAQSSSLYDDNGTDVSQGGGTVKTGNGEFSTASTAPASSASADDRWGLKFNPENATNFLFGEGVLSKLTAIPDVGASKKINMTPQMTQQVQALEQVYSTRDPRLIPGNPQFDMFAFADYLLGLRAKNTMLYQQRMGGANQGGHIESAQTPQFSQEKMAEAQEQLSEAKQLGLQGGVDRYGNRVFYDPRTKRIFKSIAEYKQSVSANYPLGAPSAGAHAGLSTD